MKNLFSKAGLREIKKFSRSKTLLAFDFDGTLIPIIGNYAHTELDSSLRQVLVEILNYLPVIIITGRGKSDLEKILNEKKWVVIGNHGIEGLSQNEKKKIKDYRKFMSDLKKHIKKTFVGIDRVYFEDKKISITCHFGKCLDPSADRESMIRQFQDMPKGPRLILGKSVLNILPTHKEDKGTAIIKVMKKFRCKRAVYIGDDHTDEAVFKLKNKNILKIRVCRSKKSFANYYVSEQADVFKVVSGILKLLMPSHLNGL